ncbi:MAG: biotin--[acetyl-CoA-carboxylase] ligase [Sphingomonas adhaesiva]|uniref:biotin--[acetyl-CoA-carboxylase] ligase n=1 Tax=Sphingomonas adhaesiva TaxID=28212 RepID=UPI002FF704B7
MVTVADTGSTNADLVALARDGAGEDGLWLRARRQTAGRGRQGRPWDSPEGNLFASTLVRLSPGEPPAPTLALVAAVALDEAVRLAIPADRARRLALKWPNDLLLAGAKLSGILLERSGDWVVIGIGVNVACHPDLPDRATTSLHAEGATLDAAAFLDSLAAQFGAWLTLWRRQGLAPVAQRWRERAHPPGTPLVARLPDGEEVPGTFETLDEDGALVLRLADGTARVIHAGDVFLVG